MQTSVGMPMGNMNYVEAVEALEVAEEVVEALEAVAEALEVAEAVVDLVVAEALEEIIFTLGNNFFFQIEVPRF